MKVVELTNLARRENPLLYRRTYTATAVIAHANAAEDPKRIEFVLEHSPLGPMHIRVKFLDEPDFSLDPTIEELEDHIRQLEERGELP